VRPHPTYAIVTPARNEAENLSRLADSIAAQTIVPAQWVIVDNGSTDETARVADRIARSHDWVTVIRTAGESLPVRGAPVVRAFNAGFRELTHDTDIVVKLDADLSFEPDHFQRLLAEFERDPALGIAGGVCWEEDRGRWRPQHTTRGHVRGAEKAYRRACLHVVLPLEERMGWDGIDELKAAVNGWRTESFGDIPVRHHRKLGVREPRVAKWVVQGEMAHYMGYRPSYLVLRALYRAIRDAAAVAMLWGYARSALRREPRVSDPDVREWLRREQGLRRLGLRAREALGRQ
jgi:glycosyltransferase involved in cell wall biosynthesis